MVLPNTSMSDRSASPVGRLDRLPVTRYQILWIVLLGLGYLIETFDNIVFSYVAPSIRSEWHLSIAEVGIVSSAVFVGMFIGAIAGGRLSDRFGRRPVLIWASAFYAATSVMSALAPNFGVLITSRVLTGLGVQAATGVIMVYVSEMFPKASRGRFFTVMTFFGFVAAPLTSATALVITPLGAGSWRWMFVLGAGGLLVAIAVAMGMPETVRWLVLNGHEAEADALVGKLEATAARRGDLPPVESAPPMARQGSFRELFKREYVRRLVVLGSTFALLVFCLYGFVSWVPTVLIGRGMSETAALGAASIITLGSLATPIILYAIADRVERKTALLLWGWVGGAAFMVFGFAANTTVVIVAGFIAQVSLSGATTSFYTYIPEVFPTEVRGVGSGTVNGIARIAGIASGIAVAAIYASLGAGRLYLFLGIGLALMGVVIVSFGPRTTRRSLEIISPPE